MPDRQHQVLDANQQAQRSTIGGPIPGGGHGDSDKPASRQARKSTGEAVGGGGRNPPTTDSSPRRSALSEEERVRDALPLTTPLPPPPGPTITIFPSTQDPNLDRTPGFAEGEKVEVPTSTEFLPTQQHPDDLIVEVSNAERNRKLAQDQYDADKGRVVDPNQLYGLPSIPSAKGNPSTVEFVNPDQPRSSLTGKLNQGIQEQQDLTHIPAGVEVRVTIPGQGSKLFDAMSADGQTIYDVKIWSPRNADFLEEIDANQLQEAYDFLKEAGRDFAIIVQTPQQQKDVYQLLKNQNIAVSIPVHVW